MEDGGQSKETQKKACLICQKEFAGDVSTCPTDGIALTVLDIPRDAMVGTLFCDRFQITEVLGGGGMGMVYRAMHLMMQRSVAIKILHTKMVGNADALKRFKVEAHAASTFSHPNILNVHDFGVSNQGQPYMVMDYLEGVNLSTLLETEKRVAVPRALNMFLQMSSALAHAHSKEIIHRDVKPSNIMLVEFEGRKDFVKLVDFGIAKVLNPANPEMENLTRTGEVFGSPLYMSPEQCKGMTLDARADIYSLGAVMYRVVTGKPIFTTSDPLETMFKQVSEMPPSFQKACPDCEIPAKLEAAIFKCLEKDRESRYQTMNDLRADLELVAAEMRPAQRQTGSINTLRLNEGKTAPKVDLDGDGWLSDLSENTGAIQVTPSFLNVQLEDVAKTVVTSGANLGPNTIQNTLQETAPKTAPIPNAVPIVVSGAVPITVPLSPFSGMVSSTAAPASAGSAPQNSADSGRAVSDKKDDTISIVVNKKSVTLGGIALAVLLATAGFLMFRPSGMAPAPAPDSQASQSSKVDAGSPHAASTTATAAGKTGSAAASSPAITAHRPHAEKKPAAPKKKPQKRQQHKNPYAQDYYPQTSVRPAPYPTIGAPITRNYSPPAEPPAIRPEPPASPPSYSGTSSGYGNSGYGHSSTGDSVRAVTGAGRALRKIKNKIRGIIDSL